MTEDELRRLLHDATEDVAASDQLRGRLSTRRRDHALSGRGWWAAGFAAAAAVITLVAVPVFRPQSAAPDPTTPLPTSSPVIATHSSVAAPPKSTTSPKPTPSAADIQACEGTADGGFSFAKSGPRLLCFFVRQFVASDLRIRGDDPTTLVSGDDPLTLVIGTVDPTVRTIVGQGLAKHSSQLCFTRYGVWVVSGNNSRTRLQGCGDNTSWQKVIDDNAPHISWSVVNPAPLCGPRDGTSPRIPAPQQAPAVRMLVVCRPGNQATVLTGSAATAADGLAQLPGVGTSCNPTGWSLQPIQGLFAFERDLPTEQTATGCQIAPQLSDLIDELNVADPPAVPDVAGLSPQQMLATLQAAGFALGDSRPPTPVSKSTS